MTGKNPPNRVKNALSDEIAGAFEWWSDAGVDCDFAEEALDRLASETTESTDQKNFPQSGASQPPLPAEDLAPALLDTRADWPDNLEAFAPWWLGDALLETSGTGPRIAPRGPQQPELMILVSQPEEEDRSNLLSGVQGRLLAGFLRAADVAENSCYIASALPRHAPLPDWEAVKSAGMGEVTLHHIALVAPKRLLVLCRNVLPLLGHTMAQGPLTLTPAQGMTQELPVLAAPGLGELMRSPPRRKRLWQQWLDWTA